MEVHRVVIHPEVDEADPNALAEPDEHRRGRGARLPV